MDGPSVIRMTLSNVPTALDLCMGVGRVDGRDDWHHITDLCVAVIQRESGDRDGLAGADTHVIEREVTTAARHSHRTLDMSSRTVRGIDPEVRCRPGSSSAGIRPGACLSSTTTGSSSKPGGRQRNRTQNRTRISRTNISRRSASTKFQDSGITDCGGNSIQSSIPNSGRQLDCHGFTFPYLVKRVSAKN